MTVFNSNVFRTQQENVLLQNSTLQKNKIRNSAYLSIKADQKEQSVYDH